MTLPDSNLKKDADPYHKLLWVLTGLALGSVLLLTLLFVVFS